MVTLAGTDAADELDDNEMTVPPAGAGPFNVAVATSTEFSLIKVGLEKLSPRNVGAETINP